MLLGQLFVQLSADSRGFIANISAAEGAMNKFMGTAERQQAVLMSISKASLGIAAGVGAAYAVAIREAANAQKANELLKVALKNVGEESADALDQLIKLSGSYQKLTGDSDDLIKRGFTKLIQTTGDFNIAMKYSKTMVDLAKGSNISYTTATQIMGMAARGNTGALSR